MNKHTPGPWKIGAWESGMMAVDGANGEEVTGFIDIADAELIAAAPEMLELLIEFKRASDTQEEYMAGTDWIKGVEAVIKKATGESE